MLGLEDGAAARAPRPARHRRRPARPPARRDRRGTPGRGPFRGDRRSVADPFRHTAEIRSLLAERARQLRGGRGRGLLSRLRGRSPASPPSGIRGAPMSGGAMHAGTIGIRTRPATRQRSGWLTDVPGSSPRRAGATAPLARTGAPDERGRHTVNPRLGAHPPAPAPRASRRVASSSRRLAGGEVGSRCRARSAPRPLRRRSGSRARTAA